MIGFVVEECEVTSSDKISIDEAVYSGNFNEYIISKSHSLDNTIIITDMLSNRDGVDIVNNSIKRLIFRDCTKSFSEICKGCKSNLIEQSDDLVFKFVNNILLEDDVKSIKILINGFDEFSESVSLDLEILNDKSKYKYKITSSLIEIIVLANLSKYDAQRLLKSFIYKRISPKSSSLKEIYVIINEKLFCETTVEF